MRNVKFLILIHSHPQPWGHPTSSYIPEAKELSTEQREKLNGDFEAVLADMRERGELLGAEALGDPATATLYRWEDGEPTATDGPYAESGDHFAGFFLIDVDSRERAEEIAATFSGPGETVELRPTDAGR